MVCTLHVSIIALNATMVICGILFGRLHPLFINYSPQCYMVVYENLLSGMHPSCINYSPKCYMVVYGVLFGGMHPSCINYSPKCYMVICGILFGGMHPSRINYSPKCSMVVYDILFGGMHPVADPPISQCPSQFYETPISVAFELPHGGVGPIIFYYSLQEPPIYIRTQISQNNDTA